MGSGFTAPEVFARSLVELEAAALHIGDVFDEALATFDAKKAGEMEE